MSEVTKIKIGDKVKCIDASASFKRLEMGKIYTVGRAYDNSPTVFAPTGDGPMHSLERFVKI